MTVTCRPLYNESVTSVFDCVGTAFTTRWHHMKDNMYNVPTDDRLQISPTNKSRLELSLTTDEFFFFSSGFSLLSNTCVTS